MVEDIEKYKDGSNEQCGNEDKESNVEIEGEGNIIMEGTFGVQK